MAAIDATSPPARRRGAALIGRRRVRVALVFAAALVAVGSVAAAARADPRRRPPEPRPGERVRPGADAEDRRGGQARLRREPGRRHRRALDGADEGRRRLRVPAAPRRERRAVRPRRGLVRDVARRRPAASRAPSWAPRRAAARTQAASAMFGGPDGALSGAPANGPTAQPVALYGKAPQGATEVAVTHADGTVTTAPVVDGWWLAVFAADTDPGVADEARGALCVRAASLGAVPITVRRARLGRIQAVVARRLNGRRDRGGLRPAASSAGDLYSVGLPLARRARARPATNSRKSGAGRVGRDLNSGWNCEATNHGWSGSSTISTSRPSWNVPLTTRPSSTSCWR